jgi:23S rRNA (cytidine2498-2'-O)-methyltransferase
MSLTSKPVHSVLVSPLHLSKQVKEEIGKLDHTQEDLLFFIHEPSNQNWIWPSTIWLKPKILKIESIKDGAKKLKEVFNGAWLSYSIKLHRRTKLIEENLKTIKIKRLDYLQSEFKPFGEWLLLDENTILYSIKTSSALPSGQAEFNEDKASPPSRAYLKLWEVFTLYMKPPTANDVVMDLGACPGGWTWVLVQHAKQVISIDKAPLEKHIAENPKVMYLPKDAFKLKHIDVKGVSWLFSDIACYPDKALELIQHWLKAEEIKKFVVTIKLQDKYDSNTLDRIKSIPGSKLVHLYQNKNELTWILQR